MQQALDLAYAHAQQGGRPFAAVLVLGDQVVATGVNQILSTHDPTAHAEMEALRAAAKAQGSPRLEGHVMYASGHPCPMCWAAMHLVGISQVYYAYSNQEAEPYGLSTTALYAELIKPLAAQALPLIHLPLRPSQGDAYALWQAQQSRP